MAAARSSKIISFSDVEPLGVRLRQAKKKIVSTNGCFDLLHYGHIQYLSAAKKLGDVLVVGVNSDSSVRALKGESRPIFPEHVRLEQLAALESVDYVFLFAERTPEKFLRCLRPQLHVKGGDYRAEDLPETSVLEKIGGKVQLLPFEPGFSTSSIIKRLQDLNA